MDRHLRYNNTHLPFQGQRISITDSSTPCMIVKMTDPLRCFKPRQTRERAPRACGLNEFRLPQAP